MRPLGPRTTPMYLPLEEMKEEISKVEKEEEEEGLSMPIWSALLGTK